MQRKSAPGCSRDPPAEKIDEERSAHEGGHGANGKLGRGYNGARERVCNYHCDGASKCAVGSRMRCRNRKAGASRAERAGHVANSAADRNRESGQNGCGDVDHEAHAANIDAEMHASFSPARSKFKSEAVV